MKIFDKNYDIKLSFSPIEEPKTTSTSWSISSSSSADYLLDLRGRHVAHFDCQCSKENNYKGTLSQILSDPLSTVPLLHIRNTNVTINVNLSHCGKLKLALDFTELLAQRSASNIDFVLKVSHLDLIFDHEFLVRYTYYIIIECDANFSCI